MTMSKKRAGVMLLTGIALAASSVAMAAPAQADVTTTLVKPFDTYGQCMAESRLWQNEGYTTVDCEHHYAVDLGYYDYWSFFAING